MNTEREIKKAKIFNYMVASLFLLLYCIPFVFLAMQEDAATGSLWFYLVMIFGFGVLGYGCAKIKSPWLCLLGNALSCLSSCLFAWHFKTDKWEYYFKPFLPNGLLLFETAIAVILQSVIVFRVMKRQKKG